VASARLAALREHDQWLLRLVRNLERWKGLTRRWAEELRDAQGKLPFTGRVDNLFSNAHSFLRRLWSFEMFAVEDTITVDGRNITGKRSVTISKIVTAILILVVGYWITGWIARWLESLLVQRFKIEANLATLSSRWVRSVMVLCLVVFSLVSVKIPLTVFAFAGGALAIGLGLGMQTLLKNLACGIIILFERPFHIGDVLDIDGQQGRVTSVGLRASVLQLWDGKETLIPNSTLLENNLTNWTYSNRLVRFSVTVGVAYGSDLRRVTQVLNEAVDRHGLVEKEPNPQILFAEFGDNALLFELRYWLDIKQAVAPQVASDLRLMIEGAFASHGIVIAFPQRDVHLDATRPLQVEVVPAATVPSAHTNKVDEEKSESKLDPTR
jgi:small-conductance mechanosensitive channel